MNSSDGQNMSGFKPANADHALTNIEFLVEFDRPLQTEQLCSLIMAPQSLATLPWFDLLPAVTGLPPMLVKSANGSVEPSGPGVQFAYLLPNGSPVWSMKIIADEIRIECSQYTRWDKVWKYALNLFQNADAYLRAQNPNPLIDRVTLQVTDRFVDAPSGYDAKELLRTSGRLGTVPFESGDLWHVFSGWFDINQWGRVLNNLNVQATGQPSPIPMQPESSPYAVSIIHMQRALLSSPVAGDFKTIHGIMENLHQRNKDALLSIITDEQAKCIKLVSL
jgi:uncharacterized protein (TIGR04255 family)